MSSWWQPDANVKVAEELINRKGWTVYDYHKHGEHKHIVFDDDIIDPASWYGIAEKNGFILVVHVPEIYRHYRNGATYKDGNIIWMPLHEAETRAWIAENYGYMNGLGRRKTFEEVMYEYGIPCKGSAMKGRVPASIQSKIEKLEAMTVARGATEFEEKTAKEKIKLLLEGCKNVINDSDEFDEGEYSEIHCPIPNFMPNPKGCTWHLEFGGVIYAKGKGMNDPKSLCDKLDDIVSNTFIANPVFLISDSSISQVSKDNIEIRYSVSISHVKDMEGQFVKGQYIYIDAYFTNGSSHRVYCIDEVDMSRRSLLVQVLRADTYKPTGKTLFVSFSSLQDYIKEGRCYFVKLVEDKKQYYFYDYVKEINLRRGSTKSEKKESKKIEIEANTIISVNNKEYYVVTVLKDADCIRVRLRINYNKFEKRQNESYEDAVKRYDKMWERTIMKMSLKYAIANVTSIRRYEEDLT